MACLCGDTFFFFFGMGEGRFKTRFLFVVLAVLELYRLQVGLELTEITFLYLLGAGIKGLCHYHPACEDLIFTSLLGFANCEIDTGSRFSVKDSRHV